MTILGFVPILAQQSDYYYYYKGSRIDLAVDSTRLFVVSEGEFQPKNITRSAELQVVMSIKSNVLSQVTSLQKQRTSSLDIYFSTIEIPKGLDAAQYDAFVETVQAENEVFQVLPSLTSDGYEMNVSNNLYVKLKSANDLRILTEMAAQYNVEILGQHRHMPLWYILSCNSSTTLSALGVANLLYETGLFACCEPETYSYIEPHSADPYYEVQWNLKNTGEYCGIAGIDINIEDAWAITKGKDAVVAVYDESIYTNHPDIADNIHSDSYDVLAGDESIASYTNKNHGNGCAGIIAAVQNNAIGLSGVAPESKVMSISCYTEIELITPLHISLGFTEAMNRGADVINCAWSYNGGRADIIDDAIEFTLNEGRNRNGCVIVFSAGNYRNSGTNPHKFKVKYPADSNPRILTVGGISPYGERLMQGLMPNNHYVFMNSCYGEQLDVVAPAALVYTINSPNGTTPSSTIYYGDFQGTSAACAHASAVAALLLSAHPNLTADQVVSIIEYTAQKVRSDLYNYQTTEGRSYGGWNEEMGYGLIDAGVAVAIADKASRTVWINNKVIDSPEHFYDYDVEVEDVLVEDGGLFEIDKDHSVILKRNIIVQRGGKLIVYKDPDFLN